ncbi:hypothetical protein ACFOY4_30905 [Actinomadura syzygii]|uniref:hypothetical protein n=1 Tax=Actinomadura syzygii TaxID=1427538 RepID=UPI00165240C1|nr:hypothetical protein [Actinomadura syzygii]
MADGLNSAVGATFMPKAWQIVGQAAGSMVPAATTWVGQPGRRDRPPKACGPVS